MGLLAAVRPDSWNLPLFLHVLGAMVAVGALVLALLYLAGAWKGRSTVLLRAAYRALVLGALPGFLVMRVAAQWLYAEEKLDELPTEPAWVDVGYVVGDAGLLFLLVATVVAGVSSRRAVAAGAANANATAIRVATGFAGLMLVAYLVAVWAMTVKPA
ncbi:MAG: hypothetical protein M3Y34_07275 [Actinomycetota bacterium]|nr:hypothetical protein [Actinomycetota bacterium]